MHDPTDSSPSPEQKDYVRHHLWLGWWTLLLFLSLGAVLEAMHAFKIQWYMSVANDNRKLLWTLAHAHGTLLALVNIAYAATYRLTPTASLQRLSISSTSLTAATVLLPGGFLLGGIKLTGGDPGLGILLVPVGAALLFASVLLTALLWSKS